MEMICQSCSTKAVIKSAVLPKVEPSMVSGANLPWLIPGKEEEQAPNVTDNIQEPFKDITASIGNHTSCILSDVERLKSQIEKFRVNVVSFFEDQWKYFARFRDCWKHQYVQEWLEFPFTCFDAHSEDHYSREYGRFILCPRFFDPKLGFKVPHALGGMRLELLNQYSRMNFPLDSFLIERFRLPKNLDLRVAGNKIIGSSLHLCWRDIHGVVPDLDHNENMPSVYIRDNVAAKKWLANHGINPWAPNPVSKPELHFREVFDQIKNNPLFYDAWQKFIKYGRLGVFWADAMAARRFATLVALSMRGTTAVFVADKKDRMAWDHLYGGKMIKSGSFYSNEIAFTENEEVIMWPAFMRAKSAVIDLYGDIDAERVEKMFDYGGRLLVIAPDPVMDFHTANIEANRVHALAGYETFSDPSLDDNTRGWRPFAQQRNAIENSIRDMTH